MARSFCQLPHQPTLQSPQPSERFGTNENTLPALLPWQCRRLTQKGAVRSDAGVATHNRPTYAKAYRTCDRKTLFSFQRGIYAHCSSFITESSLGTKAQTFCHLAKSSSLRNRPILLVAKASNRKQWRVNVGRRSWAQLSIREERMISTCQRSSLQLHSGKPLIS